MSSEMFEGLEDDFKQIYSEVQRRFAEELPKCSGELQRKLIRDLGHELEEGSVLLEKMEMNLRTAPAPFRSQMTARVRTYKRDLDQLLSNINQTNYSRVSFERGSFGYDEQNEHQFMDSSPRTRLLQGTAILSRASDSIARSHAISAETDQIGTEIIDDLGSQRDALIRTRTRLTETDQNLSQSRRILQTMSRRIMTNKLILVVIILAELGILGGVVYWRFFRK